MWRNVLMAVILTVLLFIGCSNKNDDPCTWWAYLEHADGSTQRVVATVDTEDYGDDGGVIYYVTELLYPETERVEYDVMCDFRGKERDDRVSIYVGGNPCKIQITREKYEQ